MVLEGFGWFRKVLGVLGLGLLALWFRLSVVPVWFWERLGSLGFLCGLRLGFLGGLAF